MPLYALDEEELIFASDAEENRSYLCPECRLGVRLRKGRFRQPHFSHIRTSPQCRLYSKSEDHLVAQLQLQKLLQPAPLQIERPFFDIGRVADLCWDEARLVFEIQCSLISIPEVEARLRDYASIGFAIVWLLDERLYNRPHLRPAERFLRAQSGYYLSIQSFRAYDQFEVLTSLRRLRKGPRLWVDLKSPTPFPLTAIDPDWPGQILERIGHYPRYFRGDRLDKALQSLQSSTWAIGLSYWRTLEEQLSAEPKESLWERYWLLGELRWYFWKFLDWLIYSIRM